MLNKTGSVHLTIQGLDPEMLGATRATCTGNVEGAWVALAFNEYKACSLPLVYAPSLR